MAKISRERFKVYEGVFDEFTLRTLENLKRRQYFDELGGPIKTGKEGDVYFVKKDSGLRAVKIYRLTSANFKKISEYISRDYRFANIKGSLRKVILRWAQKEYRNLILCHKANMNVPFVYKQFNNVILMDYIAGPMLKDIQLENPRQFWELVFEQMKLMKDEAKLIHGDLSEFNILVKDNVPYFIDMGQAISISNEDDLVQFYDLFERDVKNVVHYFNKRYNLELDLSDVITRLEKKN